MELTVKSRNIEIPETVREYTQKKMDKLNHHLPNLREAEVIFSQEKTKTAGTRYVVQVTINSTGMILRGEESAPDTFTAINNVMTVLDRRIERYKGKLYGKGKGAAPAKIGELAADPAEQAVPAEETEAVGNRVVKVKRFSMKPMFVDEAAEQMELLGHDFFVFFNAAIEQINVIYRREDGDYGLIEPELA